MYVDALAPLLACFCSSACGTTPTGTWLFKGTQGTSQWTMHLHKLCFKRGTHCAGNSVQLRARRAQRPGHCFLLHRRQPPGPILFRRTRLQRCWHRRKHISWFYQDVPGHLLCHLPHHDGTSIWRLRAGRALHACCHAGRIRWPVHGPVATGAAACNMAHPARCSFDFTPA